MENSQYFHHFTAYSVRNDIRRTANHELTGTRHSTWPTKGRMTGKLVNS